MTMTPLPTAPSIADPSTFEARADAFVAALALFVTEANALGTPGLGGGTMTGLLTTLAAASGVHAFVIPHGAAHATPTNGEIWTTTLGLYARVNGVTVGPYVSQATLAAASQTVAGIAEVATPAEINTGTDDTRMISPDGLAGSLHGIRYIAVNVFAPNVNMSTGDGKAFFVIPPGLNGMNLISAQATVYTAGTTSSSALIQVRNVTDAVDMLSTRMMIDINEPDSITGTTGMVINTATDDVATNDRIAIDVDQVHTTPAQGLVVTLGFQLP